MAALAKDCPCKLLSKSASTHLLHSSMSTAHAKPGQQSGHTDTIALLALTMLAVPEHLWA